MEYVTVVSVQLGSPFATVVPMVMRRAAEDPEKRYIRDIAQSSQGGMLFEKLKMYRTTLRSILPSFLTESPLFLQLPSSILC